jgi:hypothetical protein
MQTSVHETGPARVVPQPWRTYWAIREAVGALWPYLHLPAWFTARLQATVYKSRSLFTCQSR